MKKNSLLCYQDIWSWVWNNKTLLAVNACLQDLVWQTSFFVSQTAAGSNTFWAVPLWANYFRFCHASSLCQEFADFSSDDKMGISSTSKVFEYKVLPAIYIAVFFIGLLTNGWGLKLLRQKWKKLGNINVFVLNLGLANLIYMPSLTFFGAYYLMRSKWIFGHVFCKIARFCFNLNLYGSIGFLTWISVYRYLSLVHPIRTKGRIRFTHSVIVSVVVWLLVCIQSLPDTFYEKNLQNYSRKCFHTTSDKYVEDYLKYSLVWTFTGFFIPLLVTLGCYGHTTIVICRKKTLDKELKQKSLRLLLTLIILFSVCYTPYHVFKNLTLYSRVLIRQRNTPLWENTVFRAHQISRGLVCLNSALNPLIYLHVQDVWTHLRQFAERLCRCLPGREVVPQSEQEIYSTWNFSQGLTLSTVALQCICYSLNNGSTVAVAAPRGNFYLTHCFCFSFGRICIY